MAFFQSAATTVPAYRHFLREHGIDPGSVRSYADFQQLPLTTKEHYLQRHPLVRLRREGRLDTCDMVAVSSGSTGQPTFWPLGYPLTTVTPGNNGAGARPPLRAGGAAGLPPFLKDMVDAGLAKGVAWADFRIKPATRPGGRRSQSRS